MNWEGVPRRLFVVESDLPGSGTWGGSYREAVALLVERAQENRSTWWYVRGYDVGDSAGALVVALNGGYQDVGARATLGERVGASVDCGAALAAVRPGESIEVAEAPCACCGRSAWIKVSEDLVIRADVCCPHCTLYYFRQVEGFCRVIVECFALDPRSDLADLGSAGFAWGHEDAGASQTALAVLAHATASDRLAVIWYEQFKREVIAGVEPESDWRMSGAEIAEWLREKMSGKKEVSA